jgi:hypothetical protein
MIKTTDDDNNKCHPTEDLEVPEPNKLHIQDTDHSFSENLSNSKLISEEFKECHYHAMHPGESKNSEKKNSNQPHDNILDKIFFLKTSKKK